MVHGIYLASAVGAIAVYLTMPRESNPGVVKTVGALLGVASLGGVLLYFLTQLEPGQGPGLYYYIFTLIAAIGSVRVITHTRPVYSALYFVLVILSVSGLFVSLAAEFMAFAMIIIYAGAILVTYMFVLMLATQPPDPDNPDAAPECDRIAREPFGACAIGFALLGVITYVAFSDSAHIHKRFPSTEGLAALGQVPGEVEASLRHKPLNPDEPQGRRILESGDQIKPEDIHLEGDHPRVIVTRADESTKTIELTPAMIADLEKRVENIDQVGLTLFRGHTLGIELAGIILLLSMVGAVVIARKDVKHEVAASTV